MRHASIQTMMNIYRNAMTDSNCQTHSKVVEDGPKWRQTRRKGAGYSEWEFGVLSGIRAPLIERFGCGGAQCSECARDRFPAGISRNYLILTNLGEALGTCPPGERVLNVNVFVENSMVRQKEGKVFSVEPIDELLKEGRTTCRGF
jgi:hypothetical protein